MVVFTNRQVTVTGGASRFSADFAPGSSTLGFAQAKANAQGKWALKDLKSATDDRSSKHWQRSSDRAYPCSFTSTTTTTHPNSASKGVRPSLVMVCT